MDQQVDGIIDLPFFKGFEKSKVEKLINLGEVVKISKGQTLSKQFEYSHSFYFLLEGEVNFSISIENRSEEFEVGKSNEKFTPIGWSGFRSPNRYATTVQCSKDSTLYKWSHTDLDEYFRQESIIGKEFIYFVIRKSIHLLNEIRTGLTMFNNSDWYVDFGQHVDTESEKEDIAVLEPLELLRQSPFFEIFPENILEKLSLNAHKRIYYSGERVFTQGEEAKGIDLLASGRIAMCFSPEAIDNPLDDKKIEDSASLRLVQRAGYLVGWAGALPYFLNDTTAVATRNAVVYHFKREDLEAIFARDAENYLNFTKRLLWLISNYLRNARARLISQHYEYEITAIQNLMEQNATQLSVLSPLHKIPHLLKHAFTLDDAFSTLFRIQKEGTSLEKGIAGLCLDILGKVYREHVFFDGLKQVYQYVLDAPITITQKGLRIQSSKKFTDVFNQIPYTVEGWENLPDKPGNIFTYNHLINHPYNTLPNNFQITLDSHFLSSMILYKKYGDPGIRVVRVPKTVEYGHQNYYNRLGHINVYTKDSDVDEDQIEKHKEQNKMFYPTAAEYINSGVNMLLSPEGTSLKTEDSPGPFKAGAFLLAASIKPEPLIVPVVVANFDKRINQRVFSLVIKEPFRISDYVNDAPNNKPELFKFLEEYSKKYKGYVKEAVRLANKAASKKINLGLFEKVKEDSRVYSKKTMVIDEYIYEEYVKMLESERVGKADNPVIFYGSSSIRLWENIDDDFKDYNILNLAFGGATIDYCSYYFDRLIKPNKIRSMVFYAGDNDIGQGKYYKQVYDSFLIFYEKFRSEFPDTRFTYVSIKPSPERLKFISRIIKANEMIEEYLSNEDNTFYLNIFKHMMNGNGSLEDDFFSEDKLHMSRKGYELWRDIFLENKHNIF